MSAIVLPFIIYWLVFFAACFGVMTFFQDWFYDEVTPSPGLKAAVGSAVLAALATYFRPSFETIFTTNLAWTVLQAIVWVLVFMFVLQFHPSHALGLGLVTMVLISGLASLGVDNLTRPRVVREPNARTITTPLRKSLNATSSASGGAPAAAPAPAAAK